ncbi:MAG: DUF3783 domain-containing protein [Lachnospiraceae bacterium]|nr:DUF3783 domain-containing protein [Lachnospiraceae bacterium]
MRETVLLINFQDAKQLREIKMILLSMKIKMKTVEKKDYLQKIGYLAGLKDMEAVQEVYDGEELEKEMMIFANLREAQLEQILYRIRKNGVKKVDYKAILTDTNKDWNVPQLYEELAGEHEKMKKNNVQQ